MMQRPRLPDKADGHEKRERIFEFDIPEWACMGKCVTNGGKNKHHTSESGTKQKTGSKQAQGTDGVTYGMPGD